jgi:hypothetical protein
VPVAVAFATVSGGRAIVTDAPPIGDTATGADRLPGVDATGALWEIVNAVPAIVSVAVRAAPVLAATENVAVPLPVPVAPAVMVTKLALLVDVQEQVLPAVTVTEPVPPAAVNVEALIAPVDNVQLVPVGDVGVWLLLEQAAAARRSTTAGNNRQREVIMAPEHTPTSRQSKRDRGKKQRPEPLRIRAFTTDYRRYDYRLSTID